VIGHVSLLKKHSIQTENPKLQIHESPELRGFRVLERVFFLQIPKLARPLQ
jgi:hypothetical protein